MKLSLTSHRFLLVIPILDYNIKYNDLLICIGCISTADGQELNGIYFSLVIDRMFMIFV